MNKYLLLSVRDVVQERYKLRKHRKNDMESFRKMQQLRRDFDRLRDLFELVHHREKMKRLALRMGKELFEQQLHELQHPRGPKRTLALTVRFSLLHHAVHRWLAVHVAIGRRPSPPPLLFGARRSPHLLASIAPSSCTPVISPLGATVSVLSCHLV